MVQVVSICCLALTICVCLRFLTCFQFRFFLDHWLLGFFPVPAHSSLLPSHASLTFIPHPCFPYRMTTHNPGSLASLSSQMPVTGPRDHWARSRGCMTPKQCSIAIPQIFIKHPLLIRMCLVSAEAAALHCQVQLFLLWRGQETNIQLCM